MGRRNDKPDTEVAKNEALMSLLKRHRLAQGLTLGELGRKIGVTAAAVYTWESGKWEPKPRHIPKLARALGISALELTRVIAPEPVLVRAG